MKDNTRVVVILALVLMVLAVMGGGAWLWLIHAEAKPVPPATTPGGDPVDPRSAWTTAADELAIARRAVQDDGILALAVQRFRLRMGRFPTDMAELVVAPEKVASDEHWTGPYVNNERLLIDPWSKPYRIRAPGEHNHESYDLWSVGPDGVSDTMDDVGNW